MESVCQHFPPQPQHHFETLMYIYQVSRELTCGESDGLFSRQPVSIGSDGVRLPTFSTPATTPLWCVFTTSLANWLAVSPMDSSHGNPSPSARWKTRGRGTGSRGTGSRGPKVWKTRGVENAGSSGKRGVWWKTRGLVENAGYHFFRQNKHFPQ